MCAGPNNGRRKKVRSRLLGWIADPRLTKAGLASLVAGIPPPCPTLRGVVADLCAYAGGHVLTKITRVLVGTLGVRRPPAALGAHAAQSVLTFARRRVAIALAAPDGLITIADVLQIIAEASREPLTPWTPQTQARMMQEEIALRGALHVETSRIEHIEAARQDARTAEAAAAQEAHKTATVQLATAEAASYDASKADAEYRNAHYDSPRVDWLFYGSNPESGWGDPDAGHYETYLRLVRVVGDLRPAVHRMREGVRLAEIRLAASAAPDRRADGLYRNATHALNAKTDLSHAASARLAAFPF
jgi:hypothetical protein